MASVPRPNRATRTRIDRTILTGFRPPPWDGYLELAMGPYRLNVRVGRQVCAQFLEHLTEIRLKVSRRSVVPNDPVRPISFLTLGKLSTFPSFQSDLSS